MAHASEFPVILLKATMRLFNPDAVFILGDLFDEGDFVNNRQFDQYVQRFHRIFSTPSGVPFISAVGNHDVGFHYKMDNRFINRFSNYFNNTGVEMYTIKGNHFVLINSMAMLNDGCGFCNAALRDLNRISAQLKCLQNSKKCNDSYTLKKHKTYSRPILMQHFPTYRKSDAVCREHDSPVIELFRENWEVLSKESTDFIGALLMPRVSFAGHSHHYCLSINRFGIEEYTVASFSWRNKIEPSFLLASFSSTTYSVSKCDMLPQQHVFDIYIASATLILATIAWHFYQKFLKNPNVSKHIPTNSLKLD
ncbi:metallophosphoesterase 1 homolog isoform X2 [Anastrepha obliqua]|uniref:metallophosphoesterase 1 homolog isoform X2 n=1 Tax=Anastrepha obliqua TaxID=95512 RepID=UPI0024092B3F|nr:metallophosphoesterase 1 homolog isoform X2 [Anastrepha obliqua]